MLIMLLTYFIGWNRTSFLLINILNHLFSYLFLFLYMLSVYLESNHATALLAILLKFIFFGISFNLNSKKEEAYTSFLLFNCSCLFLKCFSKIIKSGCSFIVLSLGANICSPVRFPYLSNLPDFLLLLHGFFKNVENFYREPGVVDCLWGF